MSRKDKHREDLWTELLERTANLTEEAEEGLKRLKERPSDKTSQKYSTLEKESFDYGMESFWKVLDDAKERDLSPDCVGLELLYNAVHFVGIRGWSEDEVMDCVAQA